MNRLLARLRDAIVALLLLPAIVAAQDPPPRIGPLVLDLHLTVPRFPSDDDDLALSRDVELGELPGRGWGLHGGAHVYLFSVKAMTVGVGVDATAARSRHGATIISSTQTARPVTATFTHMAPELSLNFGDGDGWSYLSAGVGPSVWSYDVTGQGSWPADSERLQTTNYGGGARWFIKPHLAFSLDVRFYDINPSTFVPDSVVPQSPRTRLLIIGAGMSFK